MSLSDVYNWITSNGLFTSACIVYGILLFIFTAMLILAAVFKSCGNLIEVAIPGFLYWIFIVFIFGTVGLAFIWKIEEDKLQDRQRIEAAAAFYKTALENPVKILRVDGEGDVYNITFSDSVGNRYDDVWKKPEFSFVPMVDEYWKLGLHETNIYYVEKVVLK